MSKEFLILGNNNAITYKEIFTYIKNNELWLGFSANKTMKFQLSDSYEKWDEMDKNRKKYGKVPAITWFTNIPHNKRNTTIDLYKTYSEEKYPKYDNYDAIECSKVSEIPEDYDGVIGVPITFLDKYCPLQFEIVGRPENLDIYGLKTRVYTSQECRDAYFRNFGKDGVYDLNASSVLSDGDKLVKTYTRILIRRKDRMEPADFEIVGHEHDLDGAGTSLGQFEVNGKGVYKRLLIKRKKHNIKFLIIGNNNAITYKEIFPYIKNNKLWLGISIHSGDREFKVPDSYPLEAAGYRVDENGNKYIRVKGVRWFTNIEHNKRNKPLDLHKTYSADEYPKYDNYDAIEVSRVVEIPEDYYGVMGVPVTFLDKYCPEQFEIIGCFNGYSECDYKNGLLCGTKTEYIDKYGSVKTWNGPTINKKTAYFRILIKRVKNNEINKI